MKIASLLPLFAMAACAVQPVAQQPCAPQVETRIIDNGCKWSKKIVASVNDTKETKQQIAAHNDAFEANCPNTPQ